MKTSAKQLTVANLQELDRGLPAIAINQALRQAVKDCLDRPGNDKKREVSISIQVWPELDKQTAVLDVVNITIDVKTRTPAQTSAVYRMLTTKDGVPLFQPASPLDPRQEAFFNASGEVVDQETGEVKPGNPGNE